MTEPLLTHKGTVYPWHCDHMGHMNVMWYVGKFDEATWHLFTVLGLSPSRLRSEGAGMAAVEQHIKYVRELHPGDIISVHSRVVEVGEKWIRYEHEMRNDETDEVAATTVLVAVRIDTAARKSRPLPADVRERALKLMGTVMDASRAER